MYKEAEDDEMLRDYSKLLNRLSGLADEMSSYFRRMKQQKEDNREGKQLDPCFDPYGISTKLTRQISMDFWRWQTPRKGSNTVIICVESYVNRSS